MDIQADNSSVTNRDKINEDVKESTFDEQEGGHHVDKGPSEVALAKEKLSMFCKRQEDCDVVQSFSSLFTTFEGSTKPKTILITQDMIEPGKRVLNIWNASGSSQNDTIILSPELHCGAKEANDETDKGGITKLFIGNCSDCTIVAQCKIVTGSIEICRCKNVTVRVEENAVVPTIQVDMSQDLTLEFRQGAKDMKMWGENKGDRIFHAGVRNMTVCVLREDGPVSMETKTSNPNPEIQLLTSVMDGELVTNEVIRSGKGGLSWCMNTKATTQQEVAEENEKREKMAMLLDTLDEGHKNAIKMKTIEEE